MILTYKNKYTLFTLIIIVASSLFFFSANSASAGLFDGGVSSACKQYGNCSACDFVQTFLNMEKIALGGLGSVALIFFVYGGIILVISQGNSEQVKQAKDILINTAYGIILILFAWIIVNFIVLAMSGQTGINKIGLIFDSQQWFKALGCS